MAEDILRQAEAKGVRLWATGQELHYQARRGVLSENDLRAFSAFKAELIALLASKGRDASRDVKDTVALTFSQLAHCHLYNLKHRPSIRQIASAVRLTGRLDANALRRSLDELVRRHDALRTRILVVGHAFAQEIVRRERCPFSLEDFSRVPERNREAVVVEAIRRFILTPIDMADDDLIGATLLRLEPDEHVLVLAIEHIVSDAYSMNIAVREVLAGYALATNQADAPCPDSVVQFSEFVRRRHAAHRLWLLNHEAYWQERVIAHPVDRLEGDKRALIAGKEGWGILWFHIPNPVRAEIHKFCRKYRTTPVFAVLTAYAALLLRWSHRSRVIIQYMTDGRQDPDLLESVGYFACPLFLRIDVERSDESCVDLLGRIVQEYCTAYERCDFSYLEAQEPRPDFAKSPFFNWVPHGPNLDRTAAHLVFSGVACSPVPFVHPMLDGLERDNDPGVILYEGDDEVLGGTYFPNNRFSAEYMQTFSAAFVEVIRALVTQPEEPLHQLAVAPP